MAYSVVGNAVLDNGKTIDQGSEHGDAVRAAQDRAKPSSAVGFRQTANLVVAVDFEDAAPFLSIVDVEAAIAADVAVESDAEAVNALLRRNAAEVESAHQVEVAVKFPDHPFEHAGREYAAGDAVVRYEDGTIEAFALADFAKLFRAKNSGKPPAAARKPKAGKEGD